MSCRLCLLALLLFLFVPVRVSAQCPGATTSLVPFAMEKLTVSTTPKVLTQSIYKPSGVMPILAMISLESGSIRYAEVGTPTTTDGHPVTAPATFSICGIDSIAAFKAIRTDTDALLTITYYKSK